MKSLILKEPGEIPEFQVVDAPEPTLVPQGVIIKVAAAGVCHHDISVMDGTLRRGTKKNVVLGHEISGTVVDVGSEIEDFHLGDKVVTTLTTSCGVCDICIDGQEYICEYALGYGHGIDGGFTEYLLVKEQNLVNVGSLDLIKSALLSCPIAVTIKALFDKTLLKSHESCAVFGAGGGLGIHAAQIVQSVSGNSMAFTSSPNKLEKISQYGIEQLFLLDDGIDPIDLVMALTDDEGVNVTFNPVGLNLLKTSIGALKYGGRSVLMGEVSKRKEFFNTTDLIFKNAKLIGSTGANKCHINKAIEMVGKGLVTPVIGETFSFRDIKEAFHMIKRKESLGRIVLVP